MEHAPILPHAGSFERPDGCTRFGDARRHIILNLASSGCSSGHHGHKAGTHQLRNYHKPFDRRPAPNKCVVCGRGKHVSVSHCLHRAASKSEGLCVTSLISNSFFPASHLMCAAACYFGRFPFFCTGSCVRRAPTMTTGTAHGIGRERHGKLYVYTRPWGACCSCHQ